MAFQNFFNFILQIPVISLEFPYSFISIRAAVQACDPKNEVISFFSQVESCTNFGGFYFLYAASMLSSHKITYTCKACNRAVRLKPVLELRIMATNSRTSAHISSFYYAQWSQFYLHSHTS